jgi:hypothetical protein
MAGVSGSISASVFKVEFYVELAGTLSEILVILTSSPYSTRSCHYFQHSQGFKHDNISSYLILPAALGPGVYSASNRNEYQKHKNNVSGE